MAQRIELDVYESLALLLLPAVCWENKISQLVRL